MGVLTVVFDVFEQIGTGNFERCISVLLASPNPNYL